MLEIVWAVMAAIQLFFWGIWLARFAFFGRKPAETKPLPPEAVSVVICARNEATNLERYLPAILEQRYSADFEVILVDDDSSDHTPALARELAQRYANLRYLRMPAKTQPGKKAALQHGIAHARHAWILLTDADCAPNTAHWIENMMKSKTEESEIVLGYSPYRKTAQNWLLNAWIRWETSYTALQYFAFAQWGETYMGVGRNLLYRKDLFAKNAQALRPEIASGDDDLLINQAATARNVGICTRPEAWTNSDAPATWRGLVRQKRRHHSSSTHYRWRHQILLGALSGSHFLFYVLGAFLALRGNIPSWVWVVGTARLGAVWVVWWAAARQLGQKDLRGIVCLFDIFAVFYYAFFGMLLLFYQPNRIHWK